MCHFELVEKSSKISPFRFAPVEMTGRINHDDTILLLIL